MRLAPSVPRVRGGTVVSGVIRKLLSASAT